MSALIVVAFLFVLPLLLLSPLAASIAYFRASPCEDRLIKRLSVAAHGLVIVCYWMGVLLINLCDVTVIDDENGFFGLLAVPLVLIAYSLWQFKGRKVVHFFQAINLFSLALFFFVGYAILMGEL